MHWSEYEPTVSAVAKGHGIAESETIEEVSKVHAVLRSDLNDPEFGKITVYLLYAVERERIAEGTKGAWNVGSTIRSVIKGLAIRTIADTLGIDEEWVTALSQRIYDFFKPPFD